MTGNIRKKVFFGAEAGIFKNMVGDVVIDKNYEYCSYGANKEDRLITMLIRPKVISLFPSFVRKFIYRKVFGYNFLNGKRKEEYIFLFSNAFELYGNRGEFLLFIKFLKKYFKNSKLAIHVYDAIQTPDIKKFLSKYREYFDVVLTFNKYDAVEHKIDYYGPVNEAGIIEPQGEGEESDVFYSGGAGWARYDLIIDTFKWLSDNGKKSIFFVPTPIEVREEYFERLCTALNVSVPYNKNEEIQVDYKGSKFYFNRYISYAWALPYILKTKAMLEIIILPVGRASCTNRLAQAMAYEKKLITNSLITKEEIYYNEHNILTFSKPEDIDLNFFDIPFKKTGKDFSCGYLLKYMEYRAFGNIYDTSQKKYIEFNTEYLPIKE